MDNAPELRSHTREGEYETAIATFPLNHGPTEPSPVFPIVPTRAPSDDGWNNFVASVGISRPRAQTPPIRQATSLDTSFDDDEDKNDAAISVRRKRSKKIFLCYALIIIGVVAIATAAATLVKVLSDFEKQDLLSELKSKFLDLATILEDKSNKSIKEQSDHIEIRLFNFSKNLEIIGNRLKAFEHPERCVNGVKYNDQCIKLPYTEGSAYNFYQAKQICKRLNSHLVEIISDEMYHKVYFYVAYNWINYTNKNAPFVEVWLGSTFNAINNYNHVIQLTNGTEVNVNIWCPDFPKVGKGFHLYNKLFVRIQTGYQYESQGIRNGNPHNDEAVPLCSSYI